jgi:hypothetical protein
MASSSTDFRLTEVFFSTIGLLVFVIVLTLEEFVVWDNRFLSCHFFKRLFAVG